jgi:hypothetical protein
MKSRLLLFLSIVSLSFTSLAQKTTMMKDRLIGACFRTYSTVNPSVLFVNDSDVYTYSGINPGVEKNTGTPTANSWNFSGKYDMQTRWRYDTAAAHPPHFYLRDQTTNHYNSSNYLDTVLYQTYDTVAKAYKNYSKMVYTFDGSNNISTYLTQYWVASAWKDSTEHFYTYDGSNNMLTDTFKNLGNIASNNPRSTLSIYHYNTSVMDTSTVLYWSTTSSSFTTTNNSARVIYFLNSSKKPDSTTAYGWNTTWNANTRTHYIYSGSTVSTDTIYNLFGGTWYISTDNFTYSGSNMITDTAKAFIGSGFAGTTLYVATYDGSGRETGYEKYTLVSGTYRDTALITNTYDPTYGVLTQYMTQTRIGGAWVVQRSPAPFGGYNYDVVNKYYYTSYNDPTGVQNVTANNGTLNLYPVPANGMLNIDLTWDKAQSSVIAICDMTGRLWMQWSAENTANYKHTVYTSQLPAGNYIMKVRGEEGQTVEPFVIAR